MARVRFEDTAQGLDAAVAAIFNAFGGASLLKSSRDVYIKVNGIDFKPHVYTSPEVTAAVVRYFKARGARHVYVMENSTQGNFTRLVYEITGMRNMCEETGAIPVYLDETAEIPLYLQKLQSFISIPDFIHDHLVRRRSENLYISVPKLKSHSMTTVTLGIKNQFGLVHQMSRIPDHNFKLHQKIADIYANIRPDFTLIDGIEATNYGHYPALAQEKTCIVPTRVIVGGDDPMAVDVVATRFLGFDLEEVEHLRRAADYGFGESDFEKIAIENRDLFDGRRQHFSWDLLEVFPENVRIIRGKDLCCREGCRRNTEAVLEVFGQDFAGKGGFTILMGKGIDRGEVDRISGRVHIAGSCAIQDHGLALQRRLGRRNVTMSPGCNDLARTVHGLCRQMKVLPLSLSKADMVSSAALLVAAQLHRTRASIVPLI